MSARRRDKRARERGRELARKARWRDLGFWTRILGSEDLARQFILSTDKERDAMLALLGIPTHVSIHVPKHHPAGLSLSGELVFFDDRGRMTLQPRRTGAGRT